MFPIVGSAPQSSYPSTISPLIEDVHQSLNIVYGDEGVMKSDPYTRFITPS